MSSAEGPSPPQAAYAFAEITAESISKITQEAIARARTLEDRIGTLAASQCTFDAVVRPLALEEARMDVETDSVTFMQSVSTDKALRDAATQATKELSDFGIESSMRQDIYIALKQTSENTKSGSLDAESDRLLERMLRDKRRAGLSLSAEKQAKFKELKTQINNKCIEFRKNCDEEAGFLLLTEGELEGVPDSVLSGYEKVEDGGESKCKVTHKTPDIVPVMRYCKNPSTRRRAFLSFENRSSINTKLFQEVMELRREAASVIGYSTWADYIIEPKMAKSAKTAIDFLEDLYSKIKPIGELERDRLLALKKQEAGELKIDFDGQFNAYDYRYLDRLYTERTLKLDDEEVKQYLPVEQVVSKTFQLYQDLLGVQCFQDKKAQVWHKDVTAWTVWDKDIQGDQSFMGYLYLDLFPRENKYGHAAVFTLQPGFVKEDGSRSYPVCSMVANLAKPTADQPALLSHYDFVTFFHEMGHAWHCLLSRTLFARFAGTRVARDFVEAPSQMLENWCYTHKVLQDVSQHYKTKKPMPDELIEKIIKSDSINKGLFNLRQLMFGKFDLTVHTSKEPLDYTKLWNDIREEVALTKLVTDKLPEGQGSFAHLVGGYDVFAADPLSREKGSLYRKEILGPGGSRDEMDSLTAFLGRPPSNDAFMKKLLSGAQG
ncbi:metalloendopeptidase [Cystobasidiomycetes sp. EMM_F5]